VNTVSSASTTGRSSHVQVGSTPEVHGEVEQARQHDRERDHDPGELGLADHRLLRDDRADRQRRGLLEEPEEHDVEQQQDGVLAHAVAEVERLREHDEQDPEQQQRPGQRPQVAERRAEVAAPELGHRDQVQQIEGPGPPTAERRRTANLAQLQRCVAHGSSVASTSASTVTLPFHLAGP
jgi:hypothetical protein